jgi:hypothetical protein
MNDSGPKHPDHSTDVQLENAFLVPKDFRFGPVTVARPPRAGLRAFAQVAEGVPQLLGPLENFSGTFVGTGFNVIFRPQSTQTPTFNKTEVPVVPGDPPRDNVLQLNLTKETLSFSRKEDLENVPNRGMVQGDIFFAGVSYMQFIQDVTGLDPNNPEPGIHLEPGLWMFVGETTNPAEGPTLMRMGSIPHGTTILAQGPSSTKDGPPDIPKVSITPTINPPRKTPTMNSPGEPFRFPSQDAKNSATDRLPQDLSSFIKAGTITQELLDNPNSLLEKHIASQKIISTTTIDISTDPASPLFGGGADNMAFLLGDKGAKHPNAETLGMKATFWIETVEDNGVPSTQIQYSQQVFLNFNGLTWPHVSVASLTPTDKS